MQTLPRPIKYIPHMLFGWWFFWRAIRSGALMNGKGFLFGAISVVLLVIFMAFLIPWIGNGRGPVFPTISLIVYMAWNMRIDFIAAEATEDWDAD